MTNSVELIFDYCTYAGKLDTSEWQNQAWCLVVTEGLKEGNQSNTPSQVAFRRKTKEDHVTMCHVKFEVFSFMFC